MLEGKSLTGRSSLFLRAEVWKVLTAYSQLSASHVKRYWGSDKCGAVFRSIDRLPACRFCMGRCLCLEPILPSAVATPVAALWCCRLTCKPSWPLYECYFQPSDHARQQSTILSIMTQWRVQVDQQSIVLCRYQWAVRDYRRRGCTNAAPGRYLGG